MSEQHRYIPNTSEDRQKILEACGADSFDALIRDGIPDDIRFKGRLVDGRPGLSEFELERAMSEVFEGSRNARHAVSFIGSGSADRFCPSIVSQLTLRGEFLTAYTPYQPENSQGTLQALYEFQSMVAEIFGMEVATASHYDGSTALAEALLLAKRVQKSGTKVYVSEAVHPEYLEVCRSYLAAQDMEILLLPLNAAGQTDLSVIGKEDKVLAVALQSPNVYGVVENLQQLSMATRDVGAMSIVSVVDPVAMGLYEPPGSYGIDIVTGEGQAFGLPQSFGGPYLGLFCAKKSLVRQLPGRLCGETVDAQGKRSFTLTLSTREQHIRRDKATSNICTNQNLCALWATIWLAAFGKDGFKELAQQNHSKALYLRQALASVPSVRLRQPDAPIFNEFTVDLTQGKAQEFFEACTTQGLAPGAPVSRWHASDETGLVIAVSEKRTKDEIDRLIKAFHAWGTHS